MPYLPQTTRVFVQPKNYIERIGNLADDGSFYRIIFESGEYTQAVSRVLLTGGLVIECYPAHGAVWKPGTRLDGNTGGLSGDEWSFYAPDVRVHGLRLEGLPYVFTSDDLNEYLDALRTPKLTVGGNGILTVSDNIELTDILCTGRSDVTVVVNRSDPNDLTTVLVQDCEVIDAHKNEAFSIVGSTTAAANIKVHNWRSNCRNGPEGPNAGGVTYSSHKDGCAPLVIWRLGEGSRVEVADARMEAHVYGSHNHDLHCSRVHFLYDPDIEITYRDCQFYGNWHEGTMLGDGGGSMWMFYYHGTDGEAACAHTIPNLPLIKMENCLFHQVIGASVVDTPSAISVQAGSPARYEFWDCEFRFEDASGKYSKINQKPVDAAEPFHSGTANAEIYFHNCAQTEWPAGWNGPFISTGTPGVPDGDGNVWYDDAQTLQFGPESWHREAHTPFSSNEPVVADPGFTPPASAWTLLYNAALFQGGLRLQGFRSGFGNLRSMAYQNITVPDTAAGQFLVRADWLTGSMDDPDPGVEVAYLNDGGTWTRVATIGAGLDVGRQYYQIPMGVVTIVDGQTAWGLRFFQDITGSSGQYNDIVLDNITLTRV